MFAVFLNICIIASTIGARDSDTRQMENLIADGLANRDKTDLLDRREHEKSKQYVSRISEHESGFDMATSKLAQLSQQVKQFAGNEHFLFAHFHKAVDHDAAASIVHDAASRLGSGLNTVVSSNSSQQIQNIASAHVNGFDLVSKKLAQLSHRMKKLAASEHGLRTDLNITNGTGSGNVTNHRAPVQVLNFSNDAASNSKGSVENFMGRLDCTVKWVKRISAVSSDLQRLELGIRKIKRAESLILQVNRWQLGPIFAGESKQSDQDFSVLAEAAQKLLERLIIIGEEYERRLYNVLNIAQRKLINKQCGEIDAPAPDFNAGLKVAPNSSSSNLPPNNDHSNSGVNTVQIAAPNHSDLPRIRDIKSAGLGLQDSKSSGSVVARSPSANNDDQGLAHSVVIDISIEGKLGGSQSAQKSHGQTISQSPDVPSATQNERKNPQRQNATHKQDENPNQHSEQPREVSDLADLPSGHQSSSGKEEEVNLGVNEESLRPSPTSEDSRVQSADILNAETLKNVMHALLLGYVLSTGTYHSDKMVKKTIAPGNKILLQRGLPIGSEGWVRQQSLDKNPPEGVNGVHGIVLTNDFMQAIVVIRGTDLPRKSEDCKPKSGCRADLCADKMLWDLPAHTITSADIPEWCDDQSAKHDYVGDATDFFTNALSKLKGYQVLLVGHSLGAGLAILVGASVLSKEVAGMDNKIHIVAVSPPPFASHLGQTKLDHRYTLIYNNLDPVLWATKYRGGFQGVDPLCYDGAPKDDVARSCVKDCIPAVRQNIKPDVFGTIWAPGKDTCDLCYPDTHELGPYLKASSKDVPLKKCTFELPEVNESEVIDLDEALSRANKWSPGGTQNEEVHKPSGSDIASESSNLAQRPSSESNLDTIFFIGEQGTLRKKHHSSSHGADSGRNDTDLRQRTQQSGQSVNEISGNDIGAQKPSGGSSHNDSKKGDSSEQREVTDGGATSKQKSEMKNTKKLGPPGNATGDDVQAAEDNRSSKHVTEKKTRTRGLGLPANASDDDTK